MFSGIAQYLERKPHHLNLVSMLVLYPDHAGINLECWFLWRRKIGEPGEKQGKNQQQTQPTYNVHLHGTGQESRLGRFGGRQAPSPLHHPGLLPGMVQLYC